MSHFIPPKYRRITLYHLRWQASAWVMLPVMIFLEKKGLPLWQNLMIGQFFGALIFFQIDKFIFRNPPKKLTTIPAET